jgi:hypothetical protein
MKPERVLLSLGLALGACGAESTSGAGDALDAARPADDARVATDTAPPLDLGGDRDASSPPDDDRGDAAVDDAAPPGDAASTDGGGPPVTGLCAACEEDTDCPDPGAICLTNQTTGERFCGLDCADPESRCPSGSQCFDLGEGVLQCAPVDATCADWPPEDLGAACRADADCLVGADRCVGGLCTRSCDTVRDCGRGAPTCDAGLCRPGWATGPEGCGLGARCGAGATCGEGRVCLDALGEAPMPARVSAFCVLPCLGDDECGDGETCAPVAGQRVCLPQACVCLAESETPSLVDEALQVAGVHRCDAGFDSSRLGLFPTALSADAFRLSFFDAVHRDAPRAVRFGADVSRALGEDARGALPIAHLVARQAAAIDAPTTGEPTPVDAPAGGLAEAVGRLHTLAGRGAQFNGETVTRAFADVPAPLQAAVARVVAAQANTLEARKRMFDAAAVTAGQLNAWYEALPGALVSGLRGLDFTDPAQTRLFARDLDFGLLFTATRDLAATVEDIDWRPFVGLEGFAVDLNTPYGRLVVNDAGVRTIAGAASYLLVVDTGGDDVYLAPVAATRNATAAVSVVVELAGDDRYGYPEMDEAPQVAGVPAADEDGRAAGLRPFSRSTVYRQGAAVLGAALLFDLAGDDLYQSLRGSQGAAVGGVGVLHDAAGNDTYACEQGCQGAAAFGLGLLLDTAGRDTYGVVQSGQAFGGVRGAGVLVDLAGDDRYTALLGDPQFGGTILYDNPQNPNGSNTSFAQGAAFGRRADADGTWASGGLAVLRDEAGDDAYTVDVFGQGTGYWFGAGIFTDVAGNDVYQGRYYVQGSSAHFAISLFYEGAGNDRYNAGLPLVASPETLGPVIIGTSVGQGHDFSVGLLADYSGDDTYAAPGLGVGGGNDNGVGLFLEGGGSDRYDAPDGTTFGASNSGERGAEFESALCLGLFADADGVDTYAGFVEPSLVGNDRVWRFEDRREMRRPGMRGGGIDRNGRPRAALPNLGGADAR